MQVATRKMQVAATIPRSVFHSRVFSVENASLAVVRQGESLDRSVPMRVQASSVPERCVSQDSRCKKEQEKATRENKVRQFREPRNFGWVICALLRTHCAGRFADPL